MGRRGNGEGAIYWNAARGRYEGQVNLGVDERGKRVRRKVTGKTKTAVADRIKEIRESEMHVRRSAAVRTLSDLLDLWLDTSAAARLGEGSTLRNYRHHAQCIGQSLGKVRLDKLGPEDVDRYFLRQARAGYSRATLVRHRSILSQAVRWGVRRRHIAWDVVAVAEMPPAAVFEAATPRKKKPRQARALDAGELRRFIAQARKRRNGAALILGGTVALRPGEFTALLW